MLLMLTVSFLTDIRAWLPQTEKAGVKPDCIDLSGMDAGDRLLVLSLQGIANRGNASIYTYSHQDAWIREMYLREGYMSGFRECGNAMSLARKYKKYCSRCVVCDPDKFHSVNLAANIAGVEDRIIVTHDNLEDFVRTTGCRDVLDLEDFGFGGASDAFRWYREHIYPEQNPVALCLTKGGVFMFDVYIDYAIEFRIPIFWLPGKGDPDHDAEYEKEIIRFLADTPVNIPVFGFWTGVDDGRETGCGEYTGVKLAGKYGKFTHVNTWAGNYSYHSGVRKHKPHLTAKEQPEITYDPGKKYVALIMIESGDAPCYFMYEGFSRQWNDPDRGKVPLSYGITPSLPVLAPAVAENIYDTATPNDCFFCSISGAGYCYPFEGYGSLTDDPAACLEDYFRLTAEGMKSLGTGTVGLYTHPGQVKWSKEDLAVAEMLAASIPELKTIAAGMHRTGYNTADEACFILPSGVSVFNTVTHWPAETLTWNDASCDARAVRHLEDEIRQYGGRFTQAMFYSWYYTPERLLKVKEELEKEGYVFVTLPQLDSLYRQSQGTGN